MSSKISIVLNCHNNSAELENMLKCIEAQSIGKENIETIIFDNGSKDHGKSQNVMMNYEVNNSDNTIIIPLDTEIEDNQIKEIASEYATSREVVYLNVSDNIGNDFLESIKNRKIMNIAVALNDKYFMYTYVMLYSLMANNMHNKIRVFLLNDSLNDGHIKAFKALAMDFGAEINDIKVDSAPILEKLSLSHERFSKETYFRLGITELLPEDVDRLLYLDADTLVTGDISEMYFGDFNGNELMAVKETKEFDAGDERSRMFASRFAKGYVYFNAGVLLMNIDKLRGNYTLETYIEKLNSLKAEGFKVTFQDQDLLNLVHSNSVGYIEPEKFVNNNKYCLFSRYAWNAGMDYKTAKAYAKIIHYCGFKPWNGDGMHYDIELLWWDYAKQTVLYNQLIEEFLYKTMTDMTIFKTYIDNRLTINRLSKQVSELREENEKLKRR